MVNRFYRQIIINAPNEDIFGIIILPVIGNGTVKLLWLGHLSEIRKKIPNAKMKAISLSYLMEFEKVHSEELQKLYDTLPHKTVEIMRGVVEDFISNLVRSTKLEMKANVKDEKKVL